MNELNVTQQRYVGLDVSKTSIVVAAVDSKQQLLLQPKRVKSLDFENWAMAHLSADDVVVLEASGNSWFWHDLLQPLVGKVVLAHPQMIKLITAGRVKTDPRDAVHLAKLLAAGLLPEVWVPPKPIRELRQLVAHREGLVEQRTRLRNRLQSVLMAHHLVPVAGELFSKEHRSWWEQLPLSNLEKLLIRQQLTQLDTVELLIGEVERTLFERSQMEPWANQITYLIQLPGIGVLSALVLLSAIGDITRFASAKQLVGYSGLGAGIYASGQTVRTGGITKQGRKELRRVMVEAAWVAVEHSAHWKAQFERLAARKSKGKAIVAIARKLLVVVWHVLTHHQADKAAEEKKVAQKFFKWSSQLKTAGRGGLSRGEFIRRELTRLGIGYAVREVHQGQRRLLIPPPPTELIPQRVAG